MELLWIDNKVWFYSLCVQSDGHSKSTNSIVTFGNRIIGGTSGGYGI